MNPALSPRLRKLLLAPLLALGVLSIMGTSQVVDPKAHVRIAVDDGGTAVLAVEFDGQLFLQDYDTSGWGPIISGGSVSEMALAMDSGGYARAVWTHAPTGLFQAGFDPTTGKWGNSTLATSAPEYSYQPDLHLDPAGLGMAAWYQTAGPGIGHIRAVPLDLTGTPGLALDIPTYYAADPRAAVIDATGNGMVVWREGRTANDYTTPQVWASGFLSGPLPAWNLSPTQIDTNSGILPITDLRLASDGAGNAIAVWSQGIEIYANDSISGAGWGTAQRIDPGTVGNIPLGLQLSMDLSGNAVVAWMDGSDLLALRYDAGLITPAWEASPTVLDTLPPGVIPAPPALDTDGTGGAVVAWSGADPSVISYRVYDPATLLAPIWGPANTLLGIGNHVAVSMDGRVIGIAWSDSGGHEQATIITLP
ncbi:MAG: hypothetical protein OEY97_06890 [Nitrospirota bacterium]|nr:hypothetical protein [Nitrospirota bacterium]